MTDLQRERVISMRLAGESYGRIATTLGVSENSIKSFCQRKKLGRGQKTICAVVSGREHHCEHCGTTILSLQNRENRRFCSSSCRSAWWNVNRVKLKGGGQMVHKCLYCGMEFKDYVADNRKYCSRGCYMAHRYGKPGDADA